MVEIIQRNGGFKRIQAPPVIGITRRAFGLRSENILDLLPLLLNMKLLNLSYWN